MNKAEKVREYFKLNEMIKEFEAKKAEIADELKELGTFSTKEFNVIVEVKNRTALKGLEVVATAVGRETLEKHGLITTSQFKTIRVVKKGA